MTVVTVVTVKCAPLWVGTLSGPLFIASGYFFHLHLQASNRGNALGTVRTVTQGEDGEADVVGQGIPRPGDGFKAFPVRWPVRGTRRIIVSAYSIRL